MRYLAVLLPLLLVPTLARAESVPRYDSPWPWDAGDFDAGPRMDAPTMDTPVVEQDVSEEDVGIEEQDAGGLDAAVDTGPRAMDASAAPAPASGCAVSHASGGWASWALMIGVLAFGRRGRRSPN